MRTWILVGVAVMMLASCGKSEAEKQAILGRLKAAANHTEKMRRAADAGGASHADAVNYQDALHDLRNARAKAEAAGIEKYLITGREQDGRWEVMDAASKEALERGKKTREEAAAFLERYNQMKRKRE